VPVIEVGIVVGYLVSWAVQKARRTGRRLNETTDLAIDVCADRLDGLVRSKLRGHPALRELDEQASALAAQSLPGAPLETDPRAWAERITELTRSQLVLAIESAIVKDPDFCNKLVESLSLLQDMSRQDVTSNMTIMHARVSGAGRVYQAGRDQNIKE
jgi:hypothetical protein